MRHPHGEYEGYILVTRKIQAAVVSETMMRSTKLLGFMSHKLVITLK